MPASKFMFQVNIQNRLKRFKKTLERKESEDKSISDENLKTRSFYFKMMKRPAWSQELPCWECQQRKIELLNGYT